MQASPYSEVYVASIPGETCWSPNYEMLADWVGGEEYVSIWS